MSLAVLAIAFAVLLSAAYRLYGGWVARQFAFTVALIITVGFSLVPLFVLAGVIE